MLNQFRARVTVAIAVVAILSISAVVAISADTRPRGVASAAIFDARGKFVGTVIDQYVGSGAPLVLVKLGATHVTLSVTKDVLWETTTTALTPVIYESTDCTGQGYDGRGGMGNAPEVLIPTVLLAAGKIFIPTGEVRDVVIRSIRNADTADCVLAEGTQPAAPVAEIGDLSEFRAPFTLRAATP